MNIKAPRTVRLRITQSAEHEDYNSRIVETEATFHPDGSITGHLKFGNGHIEPHEAPAGKWTAKQIRAMYRTLRETGSKIV